MKRRLAMSLYAVLVVVSIAAVMVSAMALLYLTNLQFSVAANNGELAHMEAETALQETIARIVYQSDFGNKGETVGVVQGEQWHQLSYDKDLAVKQSSYAPDGQSHVFAVGFCRGQYRVLEAVIQPAEYNYALATEGDIKSSGSFTTRGVADVNQPEVTNRPGNVLTNGHVAFSGDVDISGSLRLSGRLQQVPDSGHRWIVGGGIEQGVARRSLPRITMSDVDSQLPPIAKQRPIITDLLPDPDFKCEDALMRAGNLNFGGALTLRQGAVRVHAQGGDAGNLHVTGALAGNGLLVADGDITIEEADMESGGQIVLIAGGTVQIKGGFFRGLVYSARQLQLRQSTILGMAVVSPSAGTQPGVSYGAEIVDSVVKTNPGSGIFTTPVTTKPGKKQGRGDAPFMLKGMKDASGNEVKSVELAIQDVMNGTADPSTLEFQPGFDGAWTWDPDAKGLYESLQRLKDAIPELKRLQRALEDARAEAGRPHPNPADQQAADEGVRNAEENLAAQESRMRIDADNLNKDYNAYKDGHATGSGSVVGKPGETEVYEVSFDLRKFLARSQAVRMVYYKEHGHKI